MSKELSNRIITGILLLLTLGSALYFGDFLFWLAIVIITAFSYREYSVFYEGKKTETFYKSTLVLGVLYFIGLYFFSLWVLPICLFAIFLYGAILVIAKYPSVAFKNIKSTLFGFVYCYVFPSGIYLIREEKDGLLWIVYIILAVVLSDVFAYFIGKKIGKRKIAPKISPNKSLEGLIAGIIIGSIGATTFAYFFLKMSILFAFVASIAIIIIGVIGDLFESHLKREANLKDSGDALPGHGGFLDRFDSVIFASGFVYILLFYIRMF
ncbi:hypothetical protein AZF37_02290 [endosymbiont 'TC1' of Trimyema compressum]|uniref:phosphatidate cytidylyltransferase n=1 Tax=endosymbiont 'TC1' of Trimyema compressum TaxID=243899 RepID=UPI0007F070B9|nr:phosphatidate cytidylyltransferase [endosymbiont 'TC1' of Trimyema compressum]AMP20153.1 hypothetical protein AZF37_02290 [endosymbiont 'TC1' of Trimyema compressum]